VSLMPGSCGTCLAWCCCRGGVPAARARERLRPLGTRSGGAQRACGQLQTTSTSVCVCVCLCVCVCRVLRCPRRRFPPPPDTWGGMLAVGVRQLRGMGGCNDLVFRWVRPVLHTQHARCMACCAAAVRHCVSREA
jgi:hypothetical protein